MTDVQFITIIKHALPGCEIQQIHLEQQVCRVQWAGQQFDISGGTLDSWPLFLVTTPECTLNDSTGKVLEMLDSMADEFSNNVKPWATTEELIRRLRELHEDLGDDYDPA